MHSLDEIRKILRDCNQSHLLQFWDQLASEEQVLFLKQLETINFKKANDVFNLAQSYLKEGTQKLDSRMKPVPPDQFESETGVSADMLEAYRKRGLEEIADNHVAVILLAGGQGTRLGVTYPKGTYPLGLPSGKTLFQIHAERIRSVIRLAKESTNKTGRVCWYIMTSQATHHETDKYLKKNNFFGLNKEDVVLFQQGLLPCFTFEGKIILERKDSVALAPDGNGGIYMALKKNKIVQDMTRRGD
ncbi:hypothetical protein NQ317_010727 [Molorchus minor]|uniref:UDP-N-acetylglucosamine diphosphorylase n=1 Tax=Molorchus minor TaxID=1323400 RepID=A0ABQ9K6N2_9CUCU|nr:hypothetical protein NQ317_010727 [Molorchus minor]